MTFNRMYKIYNPSVDLYSLGGSSPRWSKSGKAWASFTDLKRHFSYMKKYRDPHDVYAGCFVVMYESTERESPVELYI